MTEGTHSRLAATGLVLAYNVVFVAPLLVVLAILTSSGERGVETVSRLRAHLIRHAPLALPALLAVLGLGLLLVGLMSL